MVTETISMVGGHNLGRGRDHGIGRNIIPHVSTHESPIQDENMEETHGS